MRPFHYERATDVSSAVNAMAGAQGANFLAGGTLLVDLMKLDVMRPQTVVDINALQSSLGNIEANADGLKLGALARMADVADHPAVKSDYPVIAQSLQLAASAQVRNMASLGGNVLQRTRCNYFRDVSYPNCNKRNPGSGCAAMDGFNRRHAILGTSQSCIATYPGDFAQALIALDAQVDIAGRGGQRSIAFADLHKPPGDTPQIETTLQPGELITGFRIAGGPWKRSLYLKIRDRQSYEFALSSAAIALKVQGGIVQEARIALGGVATVPWRARDAEEQLKGKTLDETTMTKAALAAFVGAKGREHNSFKIELGRQTLVRGLHQAAAMEG